jgi:hypothetical protein
MEWIVDGELPGVVLAANIFLAALVLAPVIDWLLRLYFAVTIGPDWIRGPTEEVLGYNTVRADEIESWEHNTEEGWLLVQPKTGMPINIPVGAFGSNQEKLIQAVRTLTAKLDLSSRKGGSE